ncbi:MAG: iron-sulfur cluster insertion protein ErpA [Nitrospirota bacterium]|nr:iron-sulfur cluster insertion protein ErpA [Nitrospirota bacterium]
MTTDTQTSTESALVNVTEAASTKIKELLVSEGKEDYAIRLSVSGGGCHGYQYGMNFDNTVTDMDQVVETSGVKFVVDAMSVPMLSGAQVDYVETMQGAGFSISNPNAKSSCGCGSSFSA